MPIDYKKEYYKELKKSKYAWGQYFQLRNELFELQEQVYDNVNEVIDEESNDFNENHNATNTHLINFIRELYKKAKVSVECSICLERIESDDLHTTSCGHNFHSNCMDSLKANCSIHPKYTHCPNCRKRVYK